MIHHKINNIVTIMIQIIQIPIIRILITTLSFNLFDDLFVCLQQDKFFEKQ